MATPPEVPEIFNRGERETERRDRIDRMRHNVTHKAGPPGAGTVVIRQSALVTEGAILGIPLKGGEPVQTEVADGAWVGPNAVVMSGCDIGEYAIVMPGSVVLEPVQAHAVVQGNPAEVLDFACSCGGMLGIENYALRVQTATGWRLTAPLGGTATCPLCSLQWVVKELLGDEV